MRFIVQVVLVIVARIFRLISTVSWLLLCVASFRQLSAELPASRLSTVAPAGGKVGTTFEVGMTGSDLEGAIQMRFSNPDISAASKSTNLFTIKIGTNVPPGIYDVWMIGKFGASNPRSFAVGVLNEVAKTNEIHTVERAQTIPLETTVNGHTDANAIDYFKFVAHRGQCVIVACEASELDSKLEPALTLRDATGRELVRNREGARLNYPISADGAFTLSLHDVIYRGGPEYFYRLSIGTFPQIDSMLPIGGASDDKTKFVVRGHNLPSGKEMEASDKSKFEQLEVELSRTDPAVKNAISRIPATMGLNIFEYRLQNDRGLSEPACFTFPMRPLGVIDWTNHTADSAQKVCPPCEIAGEFDPDRKSSWFTFDAKKGDTWWIELLSQRLGWSSDPLLVVQHVSTNGTAADVLELNDSDENFGGPAFNTKHRDSSGRFEAKEEGTYRIQVKDLFTHHKGSLPVTYSLRLRKPFPDFQLVAMPGQPAPPVKDSKAVTIATTLLRRDATIPVRVFAFRRDGFDGPIGISLEGLSKGVTASEARIETGKNAGVVLLHADDSVETESSPAIIRGTADIAGAKVIREARAATLLWSANDYTTESVPSRKCANYLVSTASEIEPIRIHTAEPKTFEAISTNKVSIPLIIDRPGEFSIANFTVTPIGAPGLESAKEFEIGASATNSIYELDLAQQKLAPGNYVFALHGFAKGKRTKPSAADLEFTVYSEPINLKVTAPTTNAPAK